MDVQCEKTKEYRSSAGNRAMAIGENLGLSPF
jgi:hypothetical protein